MLGLCLALAACEGSPKAPQVQTPSPSPEPIVACEDYERLAVGDYVLNNNVWNKGERTDYTQCVFAQGDASPAKMGWHWNWPGTGGQIQAYPEVMYGDSPWDDEPPTGALPLPVDECELVVTYDASLEASGRWNVALEMWLTSDRLPAEENITDEVMIWVDAEGLSPGSRIYDTVTIDGARYRVFYRRGHGDASGGSSARWSYIAFLSEERMLAGTLNMGRFLDYLLEKEVIDPDRYVASLELGTEVASGEGEFTLSTYEIVIP